MAKVLFESFIFQRELFLEVFDQSPNLRAFRHQGMHEGLHSIFRLAGLDESWQGVSMRETM